ncbi:MAG: glucose dehydrogenase, partial [Chloroflexota bacterium]
TGDLYIGDVGQGIWEEINFLPRGIAGGINRGWNYYEGRHDFMNKSAGLDPVIFITPIHDYSPAQGSCSITGGYVYRGNQLPDWYGVYIFADFCSGKVWGLLQDQTGTWQNKLLFDMPDFISSFGEDEAGEIYLVSYDDTIYRLESK